MRLGIDLNQGDELMPRQVLKGPWEKGSSKVMLAKIRVSKVLCGVELFTSSTIKWPPPRPPLANSNPFRV